MKKRNSTMASNEDVLAISKRIIQKNKEAYEVIEDAWKENGFSKAFSSVDELMEALNDE